MSQVFHTHLLLTGLTMSHQGRKLTNWKDTDVVVMTLLLITWCVAQVYGGCKCLGCNYGTPQQICQCCVLVSGKRSIRNDVTALTSPPQSTALLDVLRNRRHFHRITTDAKNSVETKKQESSSDDPFASRDKRLRRQLEAILKSWKVIERIWADQIRNRTSADIPVST
ncbi:hypothetical protein ACOMHN_062745 [Nucella lapillus]